MEVYKLYDESPEERLASTAKSASSVSDLIDTDGRSILLSSAGPVYEELSDRGKGYIYTMEGISSQRFFWPENGGDLQAAFIEEKERQHKIAQEILANRSPYEKARDYVVDKWDSMGFGS